MSFGPVSLGPANHGSLRISKNGLASIGPRSPRDESGKVVRLADWHLFLPDVVASKVD